MPIQMESDSLEAKLIQLLMKGDSITLEQAAKELNVSESKLERVVKGLSQRGIVEINELPNKKFLKLRRSDIQFQGTNPSQEKAVKRKKREKEEKGSKKSRDMMYR